MTPSNVIPVVDVTEQSLRDEVFAEGRVEVQNVLDSGDSYLMLTMSNDPAKPGVNVVCACASDQIPGLVQAGVSILGMSTMAENSLANVPEALRGEFSLSIGLQALNTFIQAATKAKLAGFEKPAADDRQLVMPV